MWYQILQLILIFWIFKKCSGKTTQRKVPWAYDKSRAHWMELDEKLSK